jgi:hypothetical protein
MQLDLIVYMHKTLCSLTLSSEQLKPASHYLLKSGISSYAIGNLHPHCSQLPCPCTCSAVDAPALHLLPLDSFPASGLDDGTHLDDELVADGGAEAKVLGHEVEQLPLWRGPRY